MSTSKFAHQAALNDTAASIRPSITTPAKIVVGTEVDPLYGVTVKRYMRMYHKPTTCLRLESTLYL